jgi:hypothetical protein
MWNINVVNVQDSPATRRPIGAHPLGWHSLWCHFVGADVLRDTVAGVPGYRCACGHWEPAVSRSSEERARITRKPAYTEYRTSVTRRSETRR